MQPYILLQYTMINNHSISHILVKLLQMFMDPLSTQPYPTHPQNQHAAVANICNLPCANHQHATIAIECQPPHTHNQYANIAIKRWSSRTMDRAQLKTKLQTFQTWFATT